MKIKGKHLKITAIVILVAAIIFTFWSSSLSMKDYNESLKDAKEAREDHRDSEYCEGMFCESCEDYDERVTELSDIITRAWLNVLTQILSFAATSGLLYGVGCLVAAKEPEEEKKQSVENCPVSE